MLEQIRQIFVTLSEIMQNAILLFAILFIYNVTNFRVNTKKVSERIAIGGIISVFVIFIMLIPWRLAEGIFIDTRSILISITAVFFGWLPTLVVSIVSVSYRIFVGGAGLLSGLITIIIPAGLGLLWREIRRKKDFKRPFTEFYLFSLIVHLIITLILMLLPHPSTVNNSVIAPFLGIFPILTAIIAASLTYQIKRIDIIHTIQRQQILLQASIDSPNSMEIYALDLNYRYLLFNEFHKDSIRRYYQKRISKDMNYLDVISSPSIKLRLKNNIDLALNGEQINTIIKLEIEMDKYLEEIYQPIYDVDGQIIGVTIFSSDVTDRITQQQKVLYDSYHDALTGFKNRRYFEEKINRYNKSANISMTIVLADINGLKVMNDAFGHEAGDELLCVVSSVFKKVILPFGEIMRIGGDEFIFILENVDLDKVRPLVEQVKKELSLYTVRNLKVSASFGVARIENDLSFNEVFKLAEDEMYRNKLVEFNANRGKTIISVLKTLFSKSLGEEMHARRTAILCQKMGELLNLHNDEITLLRNLANFHDIGKVSLKEEILNKVEPLSNEEWAEIKRHPEVGYHLLVASNDYTDLAQGVLHHHERYDGRGYPQGLSGKSIPLFSRIVAIAEAYDDMTSTRPYHKAMSHKEALLEIEKNMGSQFDPEIAQLFINSFEE